MLPHASAVPKPGEINVVIFFEFICRRVLEEKAAECKHIGGRYGFDIQGPGGGSWTLDYNRSEVVEGVLADAEFALTMTTGDFSQLMQGTLDIEEALLDGRMRFRGQQMMFMNLAVIFEPSGN